MNGETFQSNQSMQIPRGREIRGHNLLHPNREYLQHDTKEGDDPDDIFMPWMRILITLMSLNPQLSWLLDQQV